MNSAPDSTNVPVKAKKAKKAKSTDPAIVAALKTKKDKRKAARFAARDSIIEFIKTYGDADVKAHAAKLWSKAMSGVASVPRDSSSRVTTGELLISLFPAGVGSSRTALEIFTAVQFGPSEMRKYSVRAIKNAKSEYDRVWVSYDFNAKTYTLSAVGKDMPKGWTGYTPLTVDGTEIQ